MSRNPRRRPQKSKEWIDRSIKKKTKAQVKLISELRKELPKGSVPSGEIVAMLSREQASLLIGEVLESKEAREHKRFLNWLTIARREDSDY